MRSALLLATVVLSVAARAQSADRDLIYMKQGGAAFTMDAFPAAKPNGAAVVFLVSGGWVSDHSQISPALAKTFTDKGYTLFQVVHGAQPRYKLPDIEAQVSRAMRFVRSQATKYKFSPDRIAVMGGSAGGHLSLMSAVLGDAGKADAPDPVDRQSSRPNAIVAFFPPTDMVNFGKEGRMPFEEADYQVFVPAFPVDPKGTEEEFRQVAKTQSPIYGVTASFPPTLLLHGDKDTLVPLQQSQRFAEALKKAGVDHRLIVVPGAGHDGSVFAPNVVNILGWLDAHLVAGTKP